MNAKRFAATATQGLLSLALAFVVVWPGGAQAPSPEAEGQSSLLQGVPLGGVWGSGSSDVSVVGDGGTMLRYDGATWSEMQGGMTNSLDGVWAAPRVTSLLWATAAPSCTTMLGAR